MRYATAMSVRQNLWRWPLAGVDLVLDRLLAVVGALAASQLPGYMNHYMQRLAGHLQEAQLNLQAWQSIADDMVGGSLDQLVTLYLTNPAPEVVAAGEKCTADIARVDELQGALTALQEAGMWQRGLEFLRQCDPTIARQTWDDFVPNVPLNLEGWLYALVGLLLALALYLLVKSALRGACRCIGRCICPHTGRAGDG
jgi:hypothetical protein